MRCATDERVILAQLKHDANFKPPAWYRQGEPLFVPTFNWLLDAFHELSTERAIGWQCGPIPVSKIREDGEERLGLDSTMIVPYVAIIRFLDMAFLEYSEQQRQKEQERAKRSNENSGRKTRFKRHR